MEMSEDITKISAALAKAQKSMGSVKKGSNNPFFKSKYADLPSVIEACKDALNENGITILQPHKSLMFGSSESHKIIDYVETILLHESGQWISSQTPVQVQKHNDPQALGSAISYARRYGLQSFISLPAEDDDGESAMDRKSTSFSKNKSNNSTKTNETKASDSNSSSKRTKFRRKKKEDKPEESSHEI